MVRAVNTIFLGAMIMRCTFTWVRKVTEIGIDRMSGEEQRAWIDRVMPDSEVDFSALAEFIEVCRNKALGFALEYKDWFNMKADRELLETGRRESVTGDEMLKLVEKISGVDTIKSAEHNELVAWVNTLRRNSRLNGAYFVLL